MSLKLAEGLEVKSFNRRSKEHRRSSGDARMRARFVVSVEAAEAVRLQRILQDRDEKEALEFLQEHCREPLRVYLKGG